MVARWKQNPGRIGVLGALLCLCLTLQAAPVLSNQTAPEISLSRANCGILSLAHLFEQMGAKEDSAQIRGLLPRSQRGHNIAQLQQIARAHGIVLSAVKVKLADLARLPLPFIVHLPEKKYDPVDGHFCIMEAVNKRSVSIFDPQESARYRLLVDHFMEIWGGIALMTDGATLTSEEPLSATMAEQIHGGDCPYHTQAGVARGDGNFGNPDQGGGYGGGTDSPGGGDNTGGDGGSYSGGDGNGDGRPDNSQCGSPRWSVNMVNMNLFIQDIPLWYTPPIGPQIRFALSYNSEYPESDHEPVGRKWTLNYRSHIEENSEDGSVVVVLPDGRRDIFTSAGEGQYTRGYKVFNTLEKIAADHFRLTFPEDTVFIYQIPAGSSAAHPLLVTWQDPWGHAVIFGHNSAGQLTTVTDPVGQVSAITYLDDRIDCIDGPFGRHAAFEYDAEGNLTKITDMGGYWTEMGYDAQSYINRIENDRGKTEFYIEPSNSDQSTTSYYPESGGIMMEHYRITVTNPEGNKAEYFYNGKAGFGWYISPRHYGTDFSYVSSGGIPRVVGQPVHEFDTVPKTKYYYTGTDNGDREEIARIVYPEGTEISFGYDTATGLRTSVSDFDGNTTQFAYNEMGRVTSITPQAGLPTTQIYNPQNHIDLEQVVRQGLGTKTISYNDHHQITQIEDEEGKTYGPITYDAHGRMVTLTETYDGQSVVTRYEYYAPGQQGEYRLQRVLKDDQVVTSYTYDAIGRVQTATDATGLTLEYEYNQLNHVTKIIYPDAKFIEYAYSSCCPRMIDSVTDRSGRTIHYEYDEMERLIREYRPGEGIVRYDYDANGNRTGITDTNNNVTRFEYDDEDRLIRKRFVTVLRYAFNSNQATLSDKRPPVVFEYNNNGLLAKRINARGVETVYGYDENHHLLSLTHSDNTPDTTFSYDDYQRLATATDALGTHIYSYYNNDRLSSVDGPWENDTLTYTYDNLNRLNTITPEGGRPRTHAYDRQGRFETLTVDGASTYAYGYQGVDPRVRSLTRPNGSQTAYDYDGLNRLKQIANKNSAELVLGQFDFEYNDQDLIEGETVTGIEAISGLTNGETQYTPNDLNQLTASSNPARNYTYDDDGNMTTGYTPSGLAYTATYDALNRLNSIEYTDGGTFKRYEFSYRHDGFLGSVRRFENAALVEELRIVRNGALAVQERDGANAILREYVWGQDKGGGIGGLLTMRQSGLDYDYLYDGKGNVSRIIDGAQAVVATYRYDSFGNLKVASGSLDQPFQFSTKRYFADLGLNYYGYRYYAPGIGRWLRLDPLEEAGGLNLYGFVQNDPVNRIDPNGLFVIGVHGGGSAGIGGVVEGSGAVIVDHTGDIAVAVDFSGTVGPMATADISAGFVIAPFANTSDLAGESKRVNIGFGLFGLTFSIPENPWNSSVSIDILPGLDYGISFGAGRTWLFGENQYDPCP